MTRARGPALRWIILTLKLAVAAALIGWLLHTGRLDPAAYRKLLLGPHLQDLILAIAWQGVAFAVFIARWRGLVRAVGLDIAWRPVFRVGLQGLATQLLIPGGLGSDGLRVMQVQSLPGGSVALGVTVVLADRVVGLVGLTVTCLIAGAIHVLTTGSIALLPGALSCLVLLTSMGGAWFAIRRLSGIRLLRRLRGHLQKLAEAVAAFRSRPTAMGHAVSVSVIGHLATGAAAYHSMQALDAGSLSYAGVIAIVGLLNMVRMVPLTPMGLGVTDTLGERWFLWIDTSLGAEQQMLQRALSVCLYLLAGLAFFWRHQDDPSR